MVEERSSGSFASRHRTYLENIVPALAQDDKGERGLLKRSSQAHKQKSDDTQIGGPEILAWDRKYIGSSLRAQEAREPNTLAALRSE